MPYPPSPGLFEAIDRLAAERTAASFESLAGLVIKHFSDEEALGLSESHLVRSPCIIIPMALCSE
jgi:hypothetical protein